MMVFSMPYFRKTDAHHIWRTRLHVFAILLLVFLCGIEAYAQGIQVNSVSVAAKDTELVLSLDADVTLNPTLEQALDKGIVLYFAVKFSLVDARWYWKDDEVVRGKYRVGLRYYALTRQYHLSYPSYSQSFNTLDEALHALGQLNDYSLTVKSGIRQDSDYIASLRIWLDLTRMPKPFQVEALGSNQWNLDSKKLEWRMRLPPPGQPFHYKDQ